MKRTSHDIPCSDHLGNIYGSIKSMCTHWNISPETFTRRIRVCHLSLEEALTRPVKHNGGLKCTDHLGEEFFSVTSMCKHWGVARNLYEYRISHNWSLEEALSTPPGSARMKKPVSE